MVTDCKPTQWRRASAPFQRRCLTNFISSLKSCWWNLKIIRVHGLRKRRQKGRKGICSNEVFSPSFSLPFDLRKDQVWLLFNGKKRLPRSVRVQSVARFCPFRSFAHYRGVRMRKLLTVKRQSTFVRQIQRREEKFLVFRINRENSFFSNHFRTKKFSDDKPMPLALKYRCKFQPSVCLGVGSDLWILLDFLWWQKIIISSNSSREFRWSILQFIHRVEMKQNETKKCFRVQTNYIECAWKKDRRRRQGRRRRRGREELRRREGESERDKRGQRRKRSHICQRPDNSRADSSYFHLIFSSLLTKKDR